MTIKSVYYWGLCAISYERKFMYNGKEHITQQSGTLLPDDKHSVIDLKENLAYYTSSTTYDELLKQRNDTWIKFCNEFLPDDTLLFITVPEQAAQLTRDLKKYDLEKYLKYKSPLAVNRNYPENGHVLQLWIFHKD